MTTLHVRKSIGRSLLLLLGFLAFPQLLVAYPPLRIPFPDSNLYNGIIYHTDGNGHQLNPPVYYVVPTTLLAWGGTPFSGYTWTISTGWTYPAGTTVDPLTGIFHLIPGGTLVSGPHNFDMTVSDGSTTVHATLSFTVTDDYMNPPAVVVFEQLNLSTFALPDAAPGLGYGASLYADGGTPPYQNWQVVSGALPPGMVLDQARGVVRGTPATGGSYSFGVDVVDSTNTHANNPFNLTYTINVTNGAHPPFFTGEVSLGNGIYYLQFLNGTPFGYYSYLSDPHWIYHFDMGYEYWFDANDGHNGIFFYDFASGHFFYTSPSFPFPYLYDFSLNALLYYYPDPQRPGHYTANPRYFYNFATGQIIMM